MTITPRIITNKLLHSPRSYRRREIKIVRQHHDRNIVVVKDNGELQHPPHRAPEVVGVAALEVTLPMDCALRPFITSSKDFEGVELAAAGGPAGAGDIIAVAAVLEDAGHVCVEEPDGGCVGEEALVCAGVFAVVHLELEEEGFVDAFPAVWVLSVCGS